MIVARVVAPVHATIKDPELDGHRLLAIRAVDLDQNEQGVPLIAIDRVDAGVGDLVLVFKEGGSARMVLSNERIAVQAVIIGVIDRIEIARS
jgi:ethanolamine utilization protein EutN